MRKSCITKEIIVSTKILVVDDEMAICDLVKIGLEADGYTVETIQDGNKAIQRFNEFEPDLVILDLMLPGMNGYDICRHISAKKPVPVIMLTAKNDLVDKVLGLEMGADDYMTKPFHMRELSARVKALLRRTSTPAYSDTSTIISNGPVKVEHESRKVTVNDKLVSLSQKEYELLAFFVKNTGKVFTREALLEKVWEYEYAGDTRTVDVHVQRLRRKLRVSSKDSDLIQTVFGVGYKMEPYSN